MKPSSPPIPSSQNPLRAWEEFIEEKVYPKPGKKAEAAPSTKSDAAKKN